MIAQLVYFEILFVFLALSVGNVIQKYSRALWVYEIRFWLELFTFAALLSTTRSISLFGIIIVDQIKDFQLLKINFHAFSHADRH